MCKINWEERIFAVAKDIYIEDRTNNFQRIFDEATAFVEAYKNAFANNSEEDKPKKVKAEPESWRTDYEVYRELVLSARDALRIDSQTREAKEKYYPNLDYDLSLDKMVDEFWGTEDGWKYKVKHAKKTAKIDMVATLKKGFDLSHNRVYKRGNIQQKPVAYKPKPDTTIIKPKDGQNPDGTFNKNGFRYYHSLRDNLDYSIPLNAPRMPSFECEYDPLTKEWYNPNDNKSNAELW